jgi:hypothetical protein
VDVAQLWEDFSARRGRVQGGDFPSDVQLAIDTRFRGGFYTFFVVFVIFLSAFRQLNSPSTRADLRVALAAQRKWEIYFKVRSDYYACICKLWI